MNRSTSASQASQAGCSGEWRSLSACRGEDPKLFFPSPRSITACVQLARARAICRRCPVCRECLDYALTTGQEFGIWGGKSEDERRALRRQLPVRAPVLPLRPAARARGGQRAAWLDSARRTG